MLIDIFILLLIAVGFYISLYFTLVYLGFTNPRKFPIPDICKLSEHTCQKIIYTRYAHLLGLPNFIYGIFYYVVSFILVISDPNSYIRIAFILIAWFVVSFGVYLIYVLLRVLKVNCVLCFISHGLNFLLAISFTIREFLQ